MQCYLFFLEMFAQRMLDTDDKVRFTALQFLHQHFGDIVDVVGMKVWKSTEERCLDKKVFRWEELAHSFFFF